MPVYSMTGYASVQSFCPSNSQSGNLTSITSEKQHQPPFEPKWQLTLELRAVNSRFLDTTLKFPEELRPYEAFAREQLQRHVRRGKVEWRAQLELSRENDDAQWVLPNDAAMQQLAQLQHSLLQQFPHAAPLSVADLLHLFAGQSAKPTLAGHEDWVRSCLQEAVVQFQAARQVEGEKLTTVLRERTDQLRALCGQAQPLVPQMVEQQRSRFLEKWQEALQQAGSSISAEAANERALTEAAAFALRIDVAEELDRIVAHVQAIEDMLVQGGTLGKRLDFLMQELHREANTLGSKSVNLESSRISMDMKVLIEQMREQVQNIE